VQSILIGSEHNGLRVVFLFEEKTRRKKEKEIGEMSSSSSSNAALQEKFQQAVAYVTKGPPMTLSDNTQRLGFYAFYKQATEGPCKSKRPGMLDLVGRHKW